MTIRDSLAQVQELLDRATPGPWAWSVNGNIVPTPYTDTEIAAVYSEHDDDTIPANAEAIIAAVNWLREHGPALLRDAGDGDAKDAARYRWLRDPKNFESVQSMIAVTNYGLEPYLLDGDELDAAIDDAMHAPGGAGGGG